MRVVNVSKSSHSVAHDGAQHGSIMKNRCQRSSSTAFPDLSMSRCAAGAFAARCSKLIVRETSNVGQSHEAIALLR